MLKKFWFVICVSVLLAATHVDAKRQAHKYIKNSAVKRNSLRKRRPKIDAGTVITIMAISHSALKTNKLHTAE